MAGGGGTDGAARPGGGRDAATSRRWATTLIFVFIGGPAWQSMLVLIVVGREQRTLRWTAVRRALWPRGPSDATGRPRGRLWWWLIPFILGLAALNLSPVGITGPTSRDLKAFLDSTASRDGKPSWHPVDRQGFAIVAVG